MNLEDLEKQAKLLVRWHRQGNYSVGERIRLLPRYRELADAQALSLKFPLSEAQEIIALEAGYESWSALKASLDSAPKKASSEGRPPALGRAIPVLFVADVQRAAEFYRDKLGFSVDFLHGHPPFYGSVSRDSARLHLRFVHEPALVAGVREREQLLSAFVAVEGVKDLYLEYRAKKVSFVQPLKKEPWGQSAFIVRDPDDNWISFNE